MTSEMPVTTITHSPEMEARRLLYLAARLPDGTLQNRGFLVLPQAMNKIPTGQIVFPNLPYDTISGFWARASKLKLQTPIRAPKELLQETMDLIKPVYRTVAYEKHVRTLENKWKSVEKTFWNNLYTLFPGYKNRISRVNIFSTQFGPYTTFSLAKRNRSEITIFIRQDSELDRLLWTILTCIFRPHMQYEMKMNWEEIEAAVDWLMSESALNCGLKPVHPTMKNIRADQVAVYRQESEKYLAKLGFRLTTKLTKTNDGYIFGDVRIARLSEQDQILLDLLLTKRGITVTFEVIAAALWPDNEDWTLYAVVKAVERLRKRIKESGVNLPVIHTERRIGYCLL